MYLSGNPSSSSMYLVLKFQCRTTKSVINLFRLQLNKERNLELWGFIIPVSGTDAPLKYF